MQYVAWRFLALLYLVSFAWAQGTEWSLSNEALRLNVQLREDQRLVIRSLQAFPGTGHQRTWLQQSAIPLRLRAGELNIDGNTAWLLHSARQEEAPRDGKRLALRLRNIAQTIELKLHLELYPGQPVLRQEAWLTNLLPRPQYIRDLDILALPLHSATTDKWRGFRVTQWNVLGRERNFEPTETPLGSEGISLQSGSGSVYCSWMTARNEQNDGVFFGWEFDGRATASLAHESQSALAASVRIDDLNHPLAPGASFHVPAAFVGFYRGDWDEAGYRTQQFGERILTRQLTKDQQFPYIAWDSWGYQRNIDEASLRAEAELAAKLGVELFIVDLGWAKKMGQWEEDPAKFPGGLRGFSDYVHSLGMKFGLHFVPLEADPDSPILQDNPHWVSSKTYLYHGAVSLCPSHIEVRDWVIREGISLIRRYNVDWVLQDGQTLVKECTRNDHTHDPADSNYSNAERGWNYILDAIQEQTPGTMWENCANGGNMMTFRMLRNYVTAITNDASGSLGARQGMFGATFPFSPRYTDRYMPAGPLREYDTRSFMFGGPWILMNKLTQLSPAEYRFLGSEILAYKQMRRIVLNSRVSHLSERPAQGRIDAIEGYNAELDTAIAIVTRDNTETDRYQLRFRELDPERNYRIRFATDRRRLTLSGHQLRETGVDVSLPAHEFSEIVYAEPLR
jgi:alpha-galactosidase